jgi:hypothetical protein
MRSVWFVRFARSAWIALTPMPAALIAMRAMRLALPAWRAVALDFFRGPLKTPQLLAQRVDLALVGGLLPLGFLEHFQHLIELIQRFTQGRDDMHHLINRLADGRRRRGLRGAGWRWRRDFPRAGVFDCGGFGGLLLRFVGDVDFRRGREEVLILGLRGFGRGLFRGFRRVAGRILWTRIRPGSLDGRRGGDGRFILDRLAWRGRAGVTSSAPTPTPTTAAGAPTAVWGRGTLSRRRRRGISIRHHVRR